MDLYSGSCFKKVMIALMIICLLLLFKEMVVNLVSLYFDIPTTIDCHNEIRETVKRNSIVLRE